MKCKLEHYSREKRKKIDPKYMGSGHAGEEIKRYKKLPRSYWYIKGSKPEGMFTGYVKHLWEGELNLYNLGDDPGEFRKLGMTNMEKAVYQHGFDGYYNSNFYPEIIALFKVIEL